MALLQAKRQRINKIQAIRWHNSTPYVYGWYIACYMVHIYCLSGSNRAYHGANDGLKIKFFIHGTQMRRIENREPYKSGYGGKNWFTRRVGLNNCYCNYLAICRYLFKQLKTFSAVDKIFEKLNYSTAFFAVYINNYFVESGKGLSCVVETKRRWINEIHTSNWCNSCLCVYRWDANQYGSFIALK